MHVRVLSRVFRRLFLQRLIAAHKQLAFFGNHVRLAHPQALTAYLAPLRKAEWVVWKEGLPPLPDLEFAIYEKARPDEAAAALAASLLTLAQGPSRPAI